MKRFLSLFLVFAVLCSCMISASAANPAVSVSSSQSAVNTGDTVTVSVKLASGSNLGAINLTVKYDTGEFQYVSGSASTSGLFGLEEIRDSKAGIVKYTGVTTGTVSKAGTLVSFKLKVLKYGGKITVSITEALDGNDKDVTSSVKATGATLKCGHGKAVWKVTKKATCTEKGVETGTCPCGEIMARDIAKTEHKVSKYTVTKEPTCTEKGVKKAFCSVCNKEYTEEIKATGHTYGKWVIVTEATETAKGLKRTECTVCGDTKEQAIPAIGTPTSAENTTELTTAEDKPEEKPSTAEITSQDPTASEATSTDIGKVPTNAETPSNDAEKTPTETEKIQQSTVKTVVITVLATLGIEAVIAGAVILVLKKRKKF